MKNLVVTLNVGGQNVIHDNARASLREAARRWDCDCLEAVSYSGGHHWHEKLRLLDHLPPGLRVVYFDGDLIVRSDLPNPLKVVPERIASVTCRWSAATARLRRCTRP